MQLTPDLRPCGPKLDRSGEAARERSPSDAQAARSRFDEHLQELSEREAPVRGLQQRQQAASAEPGRARTEAQPSDARTSVQQPSLSQSGQQPIPSATPMSTQAPSAEPKPPPTATQPATSTPPAQAADSAEKSAESGLMLAPQEEAVEVCVAHSEAPAGGELAKQSPAGSAAQDSLAATLLSIAQVTLQQPALLVSSPGLAATGASPVLAAFSADDPLNSKSLDDTPDSPAAALITGDESARAGLTLGDKALDFAGELTRARDGGVTQTEALTRSRSHQEQAAEILRQVRVGLSPDLREANIQLAPESLGRVFIHLRVEDGVLSADVHAQSAEALRALERHAPELKAALAANGVDARGLQFHLDPRGAHGGESAGRGTQPQARPTRTFVNHFVTRPVALEHALTRGLSASGIDTFA